MFDAIIKIIMNVTSDGTQTQTHEDELKHLMERMDTIERKLDLILLKLDGSIIKNCDKMGTHIDFVNGVYDTGICRYNTIGGVSSNGCGIYTAEGGIITLASTLCIIGISSEKFAIIARHL
jgi:hypothetical protein